MEASNGTDAQKQVKACLTLKNVAEKLNNFFQFKTGTVFDIGDVAIALQVPKRRLYDVLNIMQPLGVVERNGRGKYLWTGIMQPNLARLNPDKENDTSHVRDQSAKFLEFIRDTDQNVISIASICNSVFEDKKGQLRRLYDISAVFEVLNLIQRQAKTGDFIVTPQLRGLFEKRMLPPKKRAVFIIRTENSSPEDRPKPAIIKPIPQPTPLQPFTQIPFGQVWLGPALLSPKNE